MNPDPVPRIRAEWEQALGRLMATPFFLRMREGKLALDHYKALLREIYYNTRDNPSSFAMVVWHLKGKQRMAAKSILRHCASEWDHPEMALRDLRNLGEEAGRIEKGRPLPTTEALIAFPVFQIQNRHPLAYFGYIYHLEMVAARRGGEVIRALETMGVPKTAMEFLLEHAQVDPTHTRWVEDYFRQVIETEEDMEAVLYGVRGACALHGMMLQGVLDSVDSGEPPRP